MIKHNKAYKFRLYPTVEQKIYFSKCFGSVRFIYNKMLANRKELYEIYKDDKEQLKLNKPERYTSYKKEFEWLYEIDNFALANAQMNLQSAYNNYFRSNGKISFPNFKSKHNDIDSYTTNNCIRHNSIDKIRIENKCIILPKVKAVKIKQHRQIPENQIIKSCTISRTKTNKYFVSILVEWFEEEKQIILDTQKAIGLDFSMSNFYVDSQNNKADYPKFYRQAQTKLAREKRKLSKCVKGSNNYKKQKIKVALVHEKIANQRKDFLEKLSRQIANANDIVCIESLNMKAMSQCLNFGKSVMDNGWGIFVNMLVHKVKQVIKIDKWFPSSKLCNECGIIKQITLKDRKWICECGAEIDRDFNAAKNILRAGLVTI